MIFKNTIIATAMVCLFVMTAQAHVGLATPCGRYQYTAGCPAPPPGQSIDYNVNGPIGTPDNKTLPICKHLVPYTQRTVYKAGETINTAYSVGASHGGGHCQWALSYDGGKTWVVLKTLIRDCLKGVVFGQAYSVPVQIPANAPSGNATFQWIWNNAMGNREMYSNCADITIKGANGGTLSGVAPLYANYGPSSLYIPEFSKPTDPDMHEAFAKRAAVTITVSGNGKPTTTTKPKPTTTTKPKSTTTAKPKSTTTTKPKPKTTTTTKPKPKTTTTPKPGHAKMTKHTTKHHGNAKPTTKP
ncbi:hypothetical protein EDD21DRAFT_383625 [Dissophora ornata]|nr:hypothetical protein BGZ58_009768 [Dissophora ornata]KAI8598070.1 hypothetical protein EDD21DRAFT_383625 [Dissophora ornata]